MDKTTNKEFKYCVVGNIVKERIDENGSIKHGTIEFSGGTKVYLCGKPKYKDPDMIEVIGLSRMKRYNRRYYRVVYMPKKYIENIRASRTYKKQILNIMDDVRSFGYRAQYWWHDSLEDKKEVEEFVKQRYNDL